MAEWDAEGVQQLEHIFLSYYYDKFGKNIVPGLPPGQQSTPLSMEIGLIMQQQMLKGVKFVWQLLYAFSVLFQLYSLYEFDPVKDFVIDRMHLSFNTLKKEFITYMWADMGDNGAREIKQRDPSDQEIISRKHLSMSTGPNNNELLVFLIVNPLKLGVVDGKRMNS